jgi:hypothetical protein
MCGVEHRRIRAGRTEVVQYAGDGPTQAVDKDDSIETLRRSALPVELHALYSSRLTSSPKVRAFIQFLKECFSGDSLFDVPQVVSVSDASQSKRAVS